MDGDPYPTLPIYRYRARFRPRRELRLPQVARTAVLRGAFGITLRKLVCHDLALQCGACPLRKTCAYPAVFDPGAADDEPQLKRYADPPRPFVLRAVGSATPERVVEGGELDLELNVVGRVQAQAPYLLSTLSRLADDGLGPQRVPLCLDRVDALDGLGLASGVALDGAASTMRPGVAGAVRASDLARPADGHARILRVRFVTPTLLREGGEVVRVPRFGALVRRLRARVGALATLFGDGPVEEDPSVLATAADRVVTRSEEIRWASESRRSSRTGERHALEGLTGQAVYECAQGTAQAMAAFLPLLRLGEQLHVGKHASFGLGRIEVDVLG
jgi:hypothetical protein